MKGEQASIPGLTGMSRRAGTFGFRAFCPQHCGPRVCRNYDWFERCERVPHE